MQQHGEVMQVSEIVNVMVFFFRFKGSDNKPVLEKMKKDMARREAQLGEIEQTLPKENGLYLKIILGNVNVSILNKNEK